MHSIENKQILEWTQIIHIKKKTVQKHTEWHKTLWVNLTQETHIKSN